MLASALLLVLAAISSAEPQSGPDSRIIDGTLAKFGEFPYQVHLKWRHIYYQPYEALICGGTIIHQEYILTAARCVYDKSPTDVYVSVGNVLQQYGWDFEVRRFVLRDPYYEWNSANDIALVQLNSMIVFSTDVYSIPYTYGTFVPDVLNATGWGWPAFAGGASTALQYATVPTITNVACAEHWGARITQDKLCTLPVNGKGTCGKDAGGALAYHGVLIGVIGWTEYDCDKKTPEIHTRVAPFATWITNIISGRFSGTCTERF